MLKGLTAGFGEFLTRPLLVALRTLGVQAISQDGRNPNQVLISPEKCKLLTEEVNSVRLPCTFTVYDPSQVDLLPPGTWVQAGNEPDIEWENQEDRYADFSNEVAERCAARGLPLFAGSISNLNRRGLTYLEKIIHKLPSWVNISVHRYPNGMNPWNPHSGFRSREHEWIELAQIIAPRGVIVTEFGHHTWVRRFGWFGLRKNKITEQEQLEHILWDMDWFEEAQVAACFLYQLNDGPHRHHDSHFGIRRLDRTWKPASRSFKDNYGIRLAGME